MQGPAVLVLGAGRGKRMGRPKLLLPFRGSTFLERIFCRCREAGAAVTLTVSPELRGQAEAAVAALPPPPPRLVQVAGDLPMLAAVQAGLADGDFSDGFWLWPVDAPFLSAAGWSKAVGAAAGEPGAVWKLSAGGRTGHPVWFPAWSVPKILAGGWSDGLLGLLNQSAGKIRVLALEGEELRDFNTRAELAGARPAPGAEPKP